MARLGLLLLLQFLILFFSTAQAHPLLGIRFTKAGLEALGSGDAYCATEGLKSYPGGLFPPLCCPVGTRRIALAGATTVMCCPEGASCAKIAPVVCHVETQDGVKFPLAQVKTTMVEGRLPRCGLNRCCPYGYSCAPNGEECIMDQDQSLPPMKSNKPPTQHSVHIASRRANNSTATQSAVPGQQALSSTPVEPLPSQPAATSPLLSNTSVSAPGSDDRTASPGTIIAAIIFGLIVLFMVLGAFLYLSRRRRRRNTGPILTGGREFECRVRESHQKPRTPAPDGDSWGAAVWRRTMSMWTRPRDAETTNPHFRNDMFSRLQDSPAMSEQGGEQKEQGYGRLHPLRHYSFRVKKTQQQECWWNQDLERQQHPQLQQQQQQQQQRKHQENQQTQRPSEQQHQHQQEDRLHRIQKLHDDEYQDKNKQGDRQQVHEYYQQRTQERHEHLRSQLQRLQELQEKHEKMQDLREKNQPAQPVQQVQEEHQEKPKMHQVQQDEHQVQQDEHQVQQDEHQEQQDEHQEHQKTQSLQQTPQAHQQPHSPRSAHSRNSTYNAVETVSMTSLSPKNSPRGSVVSSADNCSGHMGHVPGIRLAPIRSMKPSSARRSRCLSPQSIEQRLSTNLDNNVLSEAQFSPKRPTTMAMMMEEAGLGDVYRGSP